MPPIRPIHLVELVEDAAYFQRTQTRRHMYNFQEAALRDVLLNDYRNLPVAVVSVAGAFRHGKSFLLNYFIRYLNASPTSRADGSWIGVAGQELTGFDWAPGSIRTTTGILLWPEPFIIQKDGRQVAVFLIDTQGTFDGQSSYRDNCTVFALSTLVSSLQIFNLMKQIDDNDLMNLETFTQYGIFLKNEAGEAFQELKFLIRDWERDWEYAYGEGNNGGEQYKTLKLGVSEALLEQSNRIRQRITSSFEAITCFLMPRPGSGATTPQFQNNPDPGVLKQEFKHHLAVLASNIFSPEKLRVKTLAGQPLTAEGLFHLIKNYVDNFNSDDMPDPRTVFESQSEIGLLMAGNAAIDLFERRVVEETAKSMPDAVLVDLHRSLVNEAMATFDNRRLFGEQTDIDRKKQEIRTEFSNRLEALQTTNHAYTMAAITNAAAAYDAVITDLRQHNHLCVHVTDLERAHENALVAARRVFDENRRRLTAGQEDPDNQRLFNDCQSKFEENKRTNEFNNMANVNEMKNEYYSYMSSVCNRNPKLNETAFSEVHFSALTRALTNFEARRCRSNQYPQDIFKDRLQREIGIQFEILQQINNTLHAGMIQLALAEYQQGSVSVGELRHRCLHPQALEDLHSAAIVRALGFFRPGRPQDEGFNLEDPDELILKNLIETHYESLVDVNNSANESAVAVAFEAYKEKFGKLTDYFGYKMASWDTATKYHDEAYGVARDAFYCKRRDRYNSGSDTYLENLETKCKNHYNPENRTETKATEFFHGWGAAMEQITDDYVIQDDGTLRDNW